MISQEKQAEIDKKLKKFIYDPDWAYVEDLILQYVIGLYDLRSVNKGLNNDQLAAEVRGREILGQNLVQFLNETKLIKEEKTSTIIKPPSFK